MNEATLCMCMFTPSPVISKSLMHIVFTIYHKKIKNHNLSLIKSKGNKRLTV